MTRILKIALDVPLDTLFDYRAEDVDAEDVGRRVLVSFGRRKMVGMIVALASHSDYPAAQIKPVLKVFRDTPALSPDILRLLKFCADYYHHPLGEVIFTALPQRLRSDQTSSLFCQTSYVLNETAPQLDDLPARALVKRKLLHQLARRTTTARETLLALSPSAGKHLKEMLAAGWITQQQDLHPKILVPAISGIAPELPTLNPEQAAVIERFASAPAGFSVSLLLGITGSGKTEIYLRLTATQLELGRQVLVLVPEINLTPQLEARFQSRFPDVPVVSLHSSLNNGERLHHWLLAQSGQARIVLGTRLSVFTPLPELGLIIVDEEHDSSFKQQDGLRYSARDMAAARAKQRNIPILLGSATPALESYHNALSGRYRLLRLTKRAVEEAQLPTIRCVDMRSEKPDDGLSATLLRALAKNLEHGRQSLVFINRRGYAPVLMCNQCGWLAPCLRCSSRLVVHLRERHLRCHHCGHEERIPRACPDCGNPDLAPLGQGTQRLEDSLAQHFPAARILRIDRDSTRRKHALKEMLQEVHEERVDILVGTQILAKGHDFKRLTLVGALNVDGALYSADFRAAERLFAQLMQVAGRAGRAAEPGTVLIQTQFPDHPLFEALRHQDYEAFAKDQLTERKQAGFPPFCHQALLRAEATHLETALLFLRQAKKLAAPNTAEITLYDPVPAPMARLAGRERAQLLAQADSRRDLQHFLQHWNAALMGLKARQVRWSLDVDPLDF
ncbi:MAG: primosomal protein N' [Sulfurimicrobium sp.]|jgi:primosomal protein N' (replication factor Y)|nr:primosomal protein N' [Sulfurimicrobium sp.]